MTNIQIHTEGFACAWIVTTVSSIEKHFKQMKGGFVEKYSCLYHFSNLIEATRVLIRMFCCVFCLDRIKPMYSFYTNLFDTTISWTIIILKHKNMKDEFLWNMQIFQFFFLSYIDTFCFQTNISCMNKYIYILVSLHQKKNHYVKYFYLYNTY